MSAPPPGTDPLSPLAHEIMQADPTAYTRLVVQGGAPAIARKLLDIVSPEQLLAVPVQSESAASAMLAGLWLWHDGLDQSHRISQQDETDPTLNFWHAIMHRREGDFSNSKYWYARCRNHPILKTMTPFAGDVLNHLPADTSLLRLVHEGWDSNAFVDLAEKVYDRPADPRLPAVIALQKIEWRLLFEHCTRLAAGQ